MMTGYTNWSNIYAAQRAVYDWANDTFGKDRDPMKSLQKLTMEEIPELLMHQRVWGKEQIGQELADCFILLLDLAEIWGVDLPQALKVKMAKNAAHQWVKNPTTGLFNRTERPVQKEVDDGP